MVDILDSTMGSLADSPKIEAAFKSVTGSSMSLHTIRSYIGCLVEAFLVQEAKRYIGSPMKYYFEDVMLC